MGCIKISRRHSNIAPYDDTKHQSYKYSVIACVCLIIVFLRVSPRSHLISSGFVSSRPIDVRQHSPVIPSRLLTLPWLIEPLTQRGQRKQTVVPWISCGKRTSSIIVDSTRTWPGRFVEKTSVITVAKTMEGINNKQSCSGKKTRTPYPSHEKPLYLQQF